jgi:1,2-diacylglycerol 3-alpha-glucosyltransferase
MFNLIRDIMDKVSFVKKIKVGLFIDNYFPSIDGVVMVVDNYARNLDAEVIVVAPLIDENYVDNFPYKIIRIKSINVPLTKYKLSVVDKEIKEQLIKEHFDIIHIHSPFTIGHLGIAVAKECNIPVVGTMHTQFRKEFKRYTHSNLFSDITMQKIVDTFSRCNMCYAVNNGVKQVFREYGFKKDIEIMSNATDMVFQKDTKEIDKMFNLNKDDILFLFVGRITILKNILFIADVLNELNKRKVKFKMLYVGPEQDNNLLQERINKYHLNNKVKIVSPITDRVLLAKLYRRAYLFLFPSLFDASSLVQIEASSQKTPTIFIDGSVTSNGIINNATGFLVSEDVNEFANKIEEVLHNKRLYNKVANNAYRKVYISWKKVCKDSLKKYKQLIIKNEENNER